jgi:hypothetical protein
MEYRRRGTPAPDLQVDSDSLDPRGLSAGARSRAGRSRPFSDMATRRRRSGMVSQEELLLVDPR